MSKNHKAIYDIETGKVRAFVNDSINIPVVMSNWDNVDIVEVDFVPTDRYNFNWYVDLTTFELYNNA